MVSVRDEAAEVEEHPAGGKDGERGQVEGTESNGEERWDDLGPESKVSDDVSDVLPELDQDHLARFPGPFSRTYLRSSK